jgi:hypothetical protein
MNVQALIWLHGRPLPDSSGSNSYGRDYGLCLTNLKDRRPDLSVLNSSSMVAIVILVWTNLKARDRIRPFRTAWVWSRLWPLSDLPEGLRPDPSVSNSLSVVEIVILVQLTWRTAAWSVHLEQLEYGRDCDPCSTNRKDHSRIRPSRTAWVWSRLWSLFD